MYQAVGEICLKVEIEKAKKILNCHNFKLISVDALFSFQYIPFRINIHAALVSVASKDFENISVVILKDVLFLLINAHVRDIWNEAKYPTFLEENRFEVECLENRMNIEKNLYPLNPHFHLKELVSCVSLQVVCSPFTTEFGHGAAEKNRTKSNVSVHAKFLSRQLFFLFLSSPFGFYSLFEKLFTHDVSLLFRIPLSTFTLN